MTSVEDRKSEQTSQHKSDQKPGQEPHEKPKTSSTDSTFPVFLPEDVALTLPDDGFEKHVAKLMQSRVDVLEQTTALMELDSGAKSDDDDFTMVSKPAVDLEHTTAITSASTSASDSVINPSETALQQGTKTETGQHFTEALLSPALPLSPLDMHNKILTENSDVAYRSTTSPLVDLFQEVEKSSWGPHLRGLLHAAWKEDSLATLKIIWNARSIHLGKSDRASFYRCLRWMAAEHPMTVLSNLKWVTQSVTQKKVMEKSAAMREDGDTVMVEKAQTIEAGDCQWHVKNGVAHGYWKDLLNLLVLSVDDNDKLDDISGVLNPRNDQPTKQPKEIRSGITKEEAQQRKHALEAQRHAKILQRLEGDSFYRALHFTVARLFAKQLKADAELLKTGKMGDIGQISLAAKWAPSLERFHDKHTLIATSIAEILYPRVSLPDATPSMIDRTTYLKQAREEYRRLTISPLRKALDIVERDICANTLNEIHYEKVPSLAMNKYSALFAKKDLEHFEKYIDGVAEGKTRISGAVLMPGLMVSQVREHHIGEFRTSDAKKMIAQKMAGIASKVADGQWNALVQRIRDSGTLENSIAVCDCSGSMMSPIFSDGTCPIDSSIGLSLLIAEVTKPPFGGALISFSAEPAVHRVGGKEDSRSFKEKIDAIMQSSMGYNTNFVAVFEKCILPLAMEHKIEQKDMVKQVFVFSDMQFDEAERNPYGPSDEQWSTSYERIQKRFRDAGYEMPMLVFWNLAGGPSIQGLGSREDTTVPKPVTAEQEGTALVSGYSQAVMKMFLDKGVFGDIEEEETVEDAATDDDGDVVEVRKTKKQKMDPLMMLRKAIEHPAYDMLRVFD